MSLFQVVFSNRNSLCCRFGLVRLNLSEGPLVGSQCFFIFFISIWNGLSSTGVVLVQPQRSYDPGLYCHFCLHIYSTSGQLWLVPVSLTVYFQFVVTWAQTHPVCSSLLHHRVSLCSNLRPHTATSGHIFSVCTMSTFFFCTFITSYFHAFKWNQSTHPQVFTQQSLLKGFGLSSLYNTRNHQAAPQQRSWLN